MVAVAYDRPHNTTRNPDWFNAPDSASIVPVFDDPDGDAETFLRLTGLFTMTQGEAAGHHFGDVMLPWQADAIRAMFHVKETFLMVGKGQGKSVMVSAIATAFVVRSHLLGINHRATVAVMASSVATASIVWSHIYEGILADPELAGEFRTDMKSRRLIHKASGIEIVILAPSLDQAVGRRPVLLIFDEMHELARASEAVKVCNQLRQGSRNWGRQARTITISTMPVDAPVGEFKRLLTYARNVRDGKLDDPDFLPILYEFPVLEREDLSPLDEDEWWRGVPSLRTEHQPGTMDASEFRDELRTATNAEDPEQMSMLLSQRLGIQSNLRADEAESILHAHWGKTERCSPELRTDEQTAIGIDIGGTNDPAAMAFVTKVGDILEVRCFQYITQAGYDRAPSYLRMTYDEAVEFGSMRITETVEEIEADIFEKALWFRNASPFNFLAGGDEHGGQAGFKLRFEQHVGAFNSVPQRDYIMGSALMALESKLLDGKVRHTHCPLLLANVENLKIIETDYNSRRLRKRDESIGSGKGFAKIDGIIASLCAVKLVLEHRAVNVACFVG